MLIYLLAWFPNVDSNDNNNDNMIMTVIMTLKDAIPDFWQSRHCITNCLQVQHKLSSGQGAIICKLCKYIGLLSCATGYVPTWYEGTAQLFSTTDWNHIYFSLKSLAETINWWRRGRNQSNQRNPPTMTFRKGHILKPEYSNLNQDLNPHPSIG